MDALIAVFLVLHIIGIFALLGSSLLQFAPVGAVRARLGAGMLHGALTMLVTGLALVGLNQADDQEVNNVKIAVKLAVLVVVLGLVYVNRDEERVPAPVLGGVAALTTANIFLATLW
ncbi:hypothetical protein [Streptomyces hainanensis]|uniref:Integral membrane protein n=1 Tax=Streptomyces hainanensis TaxID=402648 RepID=A0A4V2Y2S2_9ACTN|nr:hypothetical protein [Streptomyces hainanensis]TDC73775.1 hypothetical protein E1283_18145 [Streptomyces hainanensis]